MPTGAKKNYYGQDEMSQLEALPSSNVVLTGAAKSEDKADSEVTEYYCVAEFDLEGMNDIAELITGADNFELLV